MPRWSQCSTVFPAVYYYYADVVPAVVNEIQDEDGLVYTKEIIKNKKDNIINKKNTKILLVAKMSQ